MGKVLAWLLLCLLSSVALWQALVWLPWSGHANSNLTDAPLLVDGGSSSVVSAALPAPPAPVQVAASARPSYELRFKAGYLPVQWDGSTAVEGQFLQTVIADVTGDGLDDVIALATTDEPFQQLYVYAQVPGGQLTEHKRYKLPDEENSAIGLTTAHLNADWVADVVITRRQTVYAGLSDGLGGLKLVELVSTTGDKKEMPVGVVTMDLDNDGYTDLVGHVQVAHGEQYDRTLDRRSRLRAWHGNGKGKFAPHRDMAFFGVDPGPPWGIADAQLATSFIADDFNGDGLTDVAVSAARYVIELQTNPTYLIVYLNDGNGTLVESQAIQKGLEYITSIATQPSRRRDLLGVVHANAPWSEAMVYRQDAFGMLETLPSLRFKTADVPIAPMGRDLDRDGLDDLLLPHYGWGSVGFHLQRPEGFQPEAFVPLRSLSPFLNAGYFSKDSVATGDIDGDGCTDVAVAFTYDGLQVFTGAHCMPRSMSSPLPPRLLTR